MYHDTIHICFKNSDFKDISFEYNFFISKELKDKFSPINYGELLQKFDEIGFNLKYLKFYDLTDKDTVYCTYNWQPNFNIFFSAYKKILQNKDFNIFFEYGVIIDGKFYPNNMNYFAGIWFFEEKHVKLGGFSEIIIKGKRHQKTLELYQIVDKNGNLIAEENTNAEKDFEQHFFERYEVKVALRKYKLRILKLNSELSE